MTANFRELYKIISDLTGEEIKFISSKLNVNELDKVRLLNNTKTIKELNSLQSKTHKISDEEVIELSDFLKDIFKGVKENKVKPKRSVNFVRGDFDMDKVVIGPPETENVKPINQNLEEADSLKFIYDTILQYLNDHRPSYESKIIKWMDEMEDLFNKKLFKASFYYLENAYHLASQYESFIFIDSILKWKKKFVLYGIDTTKNIIEIDEEILNLREKAANYWQYKIINQKVVQGKAKIYTDSVKLQMLNDLNNQDLLQDESLALSISAKLHFHEIKAMINDGINNYSQAIKHRKCMIELCQEYPRFIYRNITPYIYMIHNYLNLCIQLDQHKEMEKGIEILNEIPQKFPFLINRVMFEDIKSKVYYHKFNLYFKSCEFYKTFKMVAEIDNFLEKSKTPIKSTFKAVLLYDLSYALYMYGKYDKSVQKLDQILSFSDDDLSKDFKLMAHCLKMINFIDSDSSIRLVREIKETKKLFKTHQINKPFYTTFLKLAEELNGSKSKVSELNIYKTYKKKLEKIINADKNWNSANYFDLASWIDSKIGSKEFRDVLKNKLRKKAS